MFNKKCRLILVSLALVLLTVFPTACNMVRVNPEVDNKTVVAKVSGKEILKEEFNKMFNIFKTQYEQQFGTEVWDQEVEGRKFGDVAERSAVNEGRRALQRLDEVRFQRVFQ